MVDLTADLDLTVLDPDLTTDLTVDPDLTVDLDHTADLDLTVDLDITVDLDLLVLDLSVLALAASRALSAAILVANLLASTSANLSVDILVVKISALILAVVVSELILQKEDIAVSVLILKESVVISTNLFTLFVATMPVKDTVAHIASALEMLSFQRFQRRVFALPMVALAPLVFVALAQTVVDLTTAQDLLDLSA